MTTPSHVGWFRRSGLSSLRPILVVGACLLFVVTATSSSLSPRGTKVEQHVVKENASWFDRTVALLGREGVLHFTEPVHEEITSRMFDCEDGCDDADIAVEYAGMFVISGVRWNDDPPFRLMEGEGQHTSCKTTETIRFTTQPRCWYQLFQAAKRQAEGGTIPDASNHAPLLARSHFGDLQFLHAMASHDGELASETQRRVMVWMEFAWKVADGQYGLDTKLKDVDVAGFDEFFGKSGWTVQDLFAQGNPSLRRHLTDVALGSVLHTVEDSFAEGHVQREQFSTGNCTNAISFAAPPRIVEFHSYAHQDEKKHKERDARTAFEQGFNRPVNVVTVGKPLVDFYEQGKSWQEVRPYLECVFAVADPNAAAAAGKEFAAR